MMKKLVVLVVLLSTFAAFASAQEVKDRPKYRNLAFVQQEIKLKGTDYKLKSEYGGAFTMGRSYYLHKKPILGLLRFGLDWSYLDLNFALYQEEMARSSDKYNYYQLEAGMQFGPSITLTPLKNLKINVYGRFAPSFSGIYNDEVEEFACAYASFYVVGGAISYKVISFGVEQRFGEAKYKFDGYDDDSSSSKVKLETTGTRFYISFRF